MRLAKRNFSFVFAVLLFLQSGGFLLFYQLKQSVHQHAMRKHLEKGTSGFETLTLPLEEFVASRIGRHEIRLNGKVYDYKDAKVNNGRIELLAIRDVDEENILQRIRNFFEIPDEQEKQFPVVLIQFLALSFVLPYPAGDLHPGRCFVAFYSPFSESLSGLDLEMPSPPPRTMLV